MLSEFREDNYNLWSTGHGPYILLCLLFFAIFIGPPLIKIGLISEDVVEFAFLIVLILGVFTISTNYLLRGGILLIAFLSFTSRILHQINPNFILSISNDIFAILTLSIFIFLMVRRFILEIIDMRYRIAAAVAIYLLFGLLWARFYQILYSINPAFFLMSSQDNEFSLIYFSFVTLVSLGYGDIVPVSVTARSLAILEGVIGQLYLVIMISSMVAKLSPVSIKEARDKILEKKEV